MADSRVIIHKVGGSVNPADLMTKYLSGDSIADNVLRMRLVLGDSRPVNAPSLQSISYCNKHNNEEPHSKFSGLKCSLHGVNRSCWVCSTGAFGQPTCNIRSPPTSALGLKSVKRPSG